ncbi:MAG: hypothetical protein N3I35_07620 [Clostridia bacterium]|nr:hypothetical protein [Clostridia bacterium]
MTAYELVSSEKTLLVELIIREITRLKELNDMEGINKLESILEKIEKM